MNIAVATTNRDKIAAIRRAFNLPEEAVNGFSADSGIPSGQPYGFDSTFQAAQTRILNLKKKLEDDGTLNKYELLVAVENGIITMTSDFGTFYLDFPVVVVWENDETGGKIFVQFGQSRLSPLEDLRNMRKEGKTEDDIRKRCDLYSTTFSKSREAIIESATKILIESMKL